MAGREYDITEALPTVIFYMNEYLATLKWKILQVLNTIFPERGIIK